MRCKFCGWDNPEGKNNCEKCNKPLNETSSSSLNAANMERVGSGLHRPTRFMSNMNLFKKTVRENDDVRNVQTCPAPTRLATCPKCGYQLENGICSRCGYYDDGIEQNIDRNDESCYVVEKSRMTIRPNHKKIQSDEPVKSASFTLTPISDNDGLECGEPVKFDGVDVSLNRDNVNPENKTITSVCQANLRFVDGGWTIEDKSELKTTYVQASRPVQLKNGDLLLLGDQIYKFQEG